MSGSLRFALILLAVVIGAFYAVKVVGAVVGWFIGSLLIPILAIGAIVGVLYVVVNRKVLGGGRRTLP